MKTVRRLALLVGLVVVAAAWSSAPAGRILGGYGLTLALPSGWYGLAAPGQLQAADFPLTSRVRGSPELARVGPGQLHLIIWDYGPAVPYLTHFQRVRAPVAIRLRDIAGGPLEGFPAGNVYAARNVTVRDELLEIVADLGPKPLTAGRLPTLNRVLATLNVRPPRVLRPHNGQLTRDGVTVRLLAGWSGRLEVPADAHAVRLVLRAARGDVHVVLLELARSEGRYSALPITFTRKDLVRRRSLLIARRVFSTGGRGFDLSVTVALPRELAQANQLLATLTAAPRPWLFRSCDLTLRLPGTWQAAINPRSGCYPVLTLRGPGVRVVLTELRPTEPASARVLRVSGRRFEVQVAPPAAERRADAVLATLRAARRS